LECEWPALDNTPRKDFYPEENGNCRKIVLGENDKWDNGNWGESKRERYHTVGENGKKRIMVTGKGW
jgi:hypothetical protein